MNWKMHIKVILPKLSSAFYAIRCMKHNSNIETLKMLYHAYCLSVVTYGAIFWGNSTDTNKVFLLTKENYKNNDECKFQKHMYSTYLRLKESDQSARSTYCEEIVS